MTFERFVRIARVWQEAFPPAEVRKLVKRYRRQRYIEGLSPEVPLDVVLDAIAKGGPPPVLERKAEPAPAVKPAEPVEHAADCKVEIMGPPKPRVPTLRGRPSIRAKALVRAQLRHGPRSEETIMAAASCAGIPERALIIAADSLGVRTPAWTMVASRRTVRQRDRDGTFRVQS